MSRNLSIWASGRTCVPSSSMGFCVASTMNGDGTRVDLARDRRLPLLHRLEHRGLRLGGGPVDLVEQHDVGVHRAQLRRELRGPVVEDLRADDVRRHEVGRALDAVERAGHRLGERLRRRRLGQPRDGLQQDVPTAHQRDDERRAQLRLPDDALVEDAFDALAERSGSGQVGRGHGVAAHGGHGTGRTGPFALGNRVVSRPGVVTPGDPSSHPRDADAVRIRGPLSRRDHSPSPCGRLPMTLTVDS